MITTFNNWIKKLKQKPKIGDYVICDISDDTSGNIIESNELISIIKNNIGQLINIGGQIPQCPYSVVYSKSDIPDKWRGGWFFNYDIYLKTYYKNKKSKPEYKNLYVHPFKIDQIKHYSKNKEDLEIYLLSNKFNI